MKPNRLPEIDRGRSVGGHNASQFRRITDSERSIVPGRKRHGADTNTHRAVSQCPYVQIRHRWSIFGLASTLFFYLFLRTGDIPGTLAVFGMFSYALMLIYDSMPVLFPNYAKVPIIQIIGWGPSVLAELVIGFWLLAKGINAQPQDIRAVNAA